MRVAELDGIKFAAPVFFQRQEDIGGRNSTGNSCFNNDVGGEGTDCGVLNENFLGVEIPTFNFSLVRIGLCQVQAICKRRGFKRLVEKGTNPSSRDPRDAGQKALISHRKFPKHRGHNVVRIVESEAETLSEAPKEPSHDVLSPPEGIAGPEECEPQ